VETVEYVEDVLEFRSAGTSGGALRCLPLGDLKTIGDSRAGWGTRAG